MKSKQSQLNSFSPHIFWDVNIHKLDVSRSKRLIVQRVLDYGLMEDWKVLLKMYGVSEISKTAVSLREIDKKSASFVALLSKIPLEKFVCFTSKQSIPEHLNF